MRNIIASIFTFLLFAVGFAFITPDATHAQNRVYHSMDIYESTGQNGNEVHPGMRTVTANVSATADINTPVCVTEWVNGQAWHRGCVPSVHLAPGQAVSVNTTRDFQGTVTYSYQDPSGNWHAINNVNNNTAAYNWGGSNNMAHQSGTNNSGWM